jgi:hypothetical protein
MDWPVSRVMETLIHPLFGFLYVLILKAGLGNKNRNIGILSFCAGRCLSEMEVSDER